MNLLLTWESFNRILWYKLELIYLIDRSLVTPRELSAVCMMWVLDIGALWQRLYSESALNRTPGTRQSVKGDMFIGKCRTYPKVMFGIEGNSVKRWYRLERFHWPCTTNKSTGNVRFVFAFIYAISRRTEMEPLTKK